jgi:hypothetical protein
MSYTNLAHDPGSGPMLGHERVLTYKCPDTGRSARTATLTNDTTLAKLTALKLSVAVAMTACVRRA